MGRKGFSVIKDLGKKSQGFSAVAQPVVQAVPEVAPAPALVPSEPVVSGEMVEVKTPVREFVMVEPIKEVPSHSPQRVEVVPEPRVTERGGFKIHAPEDPQDGLICDSCQ